MNNDKYRVGYYRYYAKALVRCKDPSTDTVFLKFMPVEVHSTVLVCLASCDEILKTIVQSELTLEYSKIVRDKIKHNVDLKNKIGKTRWKTEYIDLVIRVYKDEILLRGDVSS